MLLIDCPWCGAREQTEFAYGGEAHIVRPPNPESLSEREWADYVFFRANPRGAHFERWNHAFGCRRWFHLARDTASGRVYGSYQIGAAQPAVAASESAAE